MYILQTLVTGEIIAKMWIIVRSFPKVPRSQFQGIWDHAFQSCGLMSYLCSLNLTDFLFSQ